MAIQSLVNDVPQETRIMFAVMEQGTREQTGQLNSDLFTARADSLLTPRHGLVRSHNRGATHGLTSGTEFYHETVK